MLLKSEIKLIKKSLATFLLSSLLYGHVQAQPVACQPGKKPDGSVICAPPLKDLRTKLNDKYLTAYLVTDAPIRLLDDTQHMWLNRLQQCKNNTCRQHQFDLRFEDLNFYTSMNQSLTQHFIKYEQGQVAKSPVHIQVHQLSKDRIKIEGQAYRSPNNSGDKQSIALLAYTTPEKKNEIVDNEHDCKYQLNFEKAVLVIKTTQKGCERFTGVYRLYD